MQIYFESSILKEEFNNTSIGILDNLPDINIIFIYVGENYCDDIYSRYKENVKIVSYNKKIDYRFVNCSLDNLHEYLLHSHTSVNLTYKITGFNGLSHFEYHKYFRGWKYCPDGEIVDCHIYANDGTSKPDWITKSSLKSCVDGIIDKSQLSTIMGKYMAPEYSLNKVLYKGQCVSDTTIILKPVGKMAFGGRGIQIINKGDKVKLERRWKYVACKYLKNIQTFKGRKFHLRVYLFVSTWGMWKLVPTYRIITAKREYKLDDWKNKEIHDSHLNSTDRDYFYHQGGDLYDPYVDSQIQNICKVLISHIKVKAYSETLNAYEMLGIDFMILSDSTVVLIEVNNNAGIKCVDSSQNWFKNEVQSIEFAFITHHFQ